MEFLDTYNPRTDFIKSAKDKLEIKIEHFDIVAIHKLPTKTETKFKTKKFHFHETKFSLLKKASKLKNSNIYINEHLTKKNSDIFYKARQLRKVNKLHSCWTINGSTFIKLTENSNKKRISHIDELEDL